MAKMEKRKFRIGELAHHLNVERFVIRFWEKEFNIKAQRSIGGQRFYNLNDLKKFQTIKELLYQKKFTIAGAKQIFTKNITKPIDPLATIMASHVTNIEDPSNELRSKNTLSQQVLKELAELKNNLIKLRKLL